MWQWVVVGLMAIAPSNAGAPAREPREIVVRLSSQAAFLRSDAPEKVVSSSVGEGKTFGLCLDGYLRCWQVTGLRAALTRLERASMTETTLWTLLHEIADPDHVAWGWRAGESKLLFPNGSELAVFGWLDAGRMLSAKFGWVGVDQAEQIRREHFTTIKTRMRQTGLPFPPQIALACNAEDPDHWINRRYSIESQGARVERYEDGRPKFEVILSTPGEAVIYNGAAYYEGLESLKGTVFYERLVLGRWARAEGLLFPMWNGSHVVDAPTAWAEWGGYPPPDWERFRGLDFGIRNPFACLTWAKSPEGVFYRYRERYMTGKPPEDHASGIVADEARELEALRAHCPAERAQELKPFLEALNVVDSIRDPAAAESAATLKRHGVWSRAGKNDILAGVEIVVSLLNQRKILWVRNALVERDINLAAQELPTCSEEEMPLGRYQKVPDGANPRDDRKDLPVDEKNHGVKTLTYLFLTLASRRQAAIYV